MRESVRSEWSAVPANIRSGIDDLLGRRVIEATNLSGGFSPGPAARCVIEGGDLVFVKAAGTSPNAEAPTFHRNEARVLAALPDDHPAPRLIGTVDDRDWIALVIEWIPGATPDVPLSAPEVRRMLAVPQRLSAAGAQVHPDGILPFAERHPGLTGNWQRLGGDDDGLVDRLDRWSVAHLDRLAELDVDGASAAAGDTLLHLDLRTDNVLFSEHGPGHDVAVDWPSAAVGAAWVDLVTMLPALHLDGAPPPHELFDEHPLGRAADDDAVTAFLASFTGFLTRQALLPPPPGLPTLRRFQDEQGRIARTWLAGRLGLPSPHAQF